MQKRVSIEEAVGLPLAHDITEIRKGEFKGPAFKKGHIVRQEDLSHLRRLGKTHLFVLQPEKDELHEDEAVEILAAALCGENVGWEGQPSEGKLKLMALTNGLFKVDVSALLAFNMLGEVMCATRHGNIMVSKGQEVAGTRAIPLLIKKEVVQKAAEIGRSVAGILRVVPLKPHKVGVIITGNEVFEGLIQDRFEPIIREKVAALASEVMAVIFTPDDSSRIAGVIKNMVKDGAEAIVTTGGMSVDPDDVTRLGIRQAGAKDVIYGSPVLPGAMFLIAYLKNIPIVGVPACGLFFKATVFDLVFPRILAGETITRADIAALGYGGLCLNCGSCRFPDCAFGKAGEWTTQL
jgi:hypothetical protein